MMNMMTTDEETVKRFFDSGGEMKSRAAFERAATKRKPGGPRKYPLEAV